MAWSEAVERTQAAQEATTVGLRQFQQLLRSQACTWILLKHLHTQILKYLGWNAAIKELQITD